jgi:hypothetical protein
MPIGGLSLPGIAAESERASQTEVRQRRGEDPDSERIVVLMRPILHRGRPLDEVLKVRWIGVISSFRSSCITGESPRSPVWRTIDVG